MQQRALKRWTLPSPAATAEVRTADGLSITIRRHGNPRGPRIVMNNGNGLAADLYFPFWSLLADRFDLVLYDLRSHGEYPTHCEAQARLQSADRASLPNRSIAARV